MARGIKTKPRAITASGAFVSLSLEHREELERIERETGARRSAVIRLALDHYLRGRRKPDRPQPAA